MCREALPLCLGQAGLAIVVTCECALAQGFVEADGAGYRDIEGLHHAYLWYDEIGVAMTKTFGCDACMFVAKDESYRLGEIEII